MSVGTLHSIPSSSHISAETLPRRPGRFQDPRGHRARLTHAVGDADPVVRGPAEMQPRDVFGGAFDALESLLVTDEGLGVALRVMEGACELGLCGDAEHVAQL